VRSGSGVEGGARKGGRGDGCGTETTPEVGTGSGSGVRGGGERAWSQFVDELTKETVRCATSLPSHELYALL